MLIVRVKTKGQVTLPVAIRERARVRIGDTLEARVEKTGTIILTPQSIIDRRLAESMADIKAGRTYGPFDSVDDMFVFLDKKVKRAKKSHRK